MIFSADVSSKNEQTNSTLLPWYLFSFVFWKKLKTPKRHFEINWPLFLEVSQIKYIRTIIVKVGKNDWDWEAYRKSCYFHCSVLPQEWLLSQPDSGLNSESSGSINFVEKSDFGLATWVSEGHDGETAKQHLFFTTL